MKKLVPGLLQQLSRKFFGLCTFLIIYYAGNAQMRELHSEPQATFQEFHKLSFYSPSQGYMVSNGTNSYIAFTQDSGRTFVQRPITTSNVNYNGYTVSLPFLMEGVHAFNKDTLVVYGAFNLVPAILYSTNGGLNFLLAFHSSYRTAYSKIYDMKFPSSGGVGYAVDLGRVLKTTDYGKNWTVVRSETTGILGGIDAVDNNYLFAYTTFFAGQGNKLIKSVNAGITWQSLTSPTPYIHTVDFISPLKGWVTGGDTDEPDMIYYTSDGGITWAAQSNPAQEYNTFFDLQFINDSTGFAISEFYETLKTSDTGRVWEPLPRDLNYQSNLNTHSDLFIYDNSQLWAGGNKNLLELNTNLSGQPLPKAFFSIDTTGFRTAGRVELRNFSRKDYQYSWYVNNVFISNSYNTFYTHNSTSTLDSVVLIVSGNGRNDTLKRYQYFPLPTLALITSFEPSHGTTGTEIQVRGRNFNLVTAVKFGNVAATGFTVMSDSIMKAVVGVGATGSITLSTPDGPYSIQGFTYYSLPIVSPPSVTTFSPMEGPAGTTVTITGTGFSTLPSGNAIFFGAVRATVSSSSATQLICTVPPGATFEPVTVLNTTTGLTGKSALPFAVTFPGETNFTRHSFELAHRIRLTSNNPQVRSASSADIDGDGKPDIIAAMWTTLGDSLFISRNTSTPGSFSFESPKKYKANAYIGILPTDFDGDGRPDILSATDRTAPGVPSKTIVNVFLNKSVPGNIVMEIAISRMENSGNVDFGTGDLDNDGRPDILLVNSTDKNVSVIRNTSLPGLLSFAEVKRFATDGTAYAAVAGDIDGDGKTDMVTHNETTSGSKLFFFRGSGTPGTISFFPKTELTAPSASGYHKLRLVDTDGDFKADLVFVTAGNINIFKNTSTTGNLSFGAVRSFPITGNEPGSLVENLSGDSRPDFTIREWSANDAGFQLRRNIAASGTVDLDPLQPATANGVYNGPAIGSGDFDLDGKTDIITGTTVINDESFIIWKNKSGEPVNELACSGRTKQLICDVTGTTYQWQEDRGAGFVNLSNGSVYSNVTGALLLINPVSVSMNGYKYRCIAGNFLSSTFILQADPLVSPSVTISTPSTSLCAGMTANFTATPLNQGTTTTYRWYVNNVQSGTNSPLFTTPVLTANAAVRLEMISSACATNPLANSNIVNLSVTGTLPTVTISTAATTVCPGSNVTFTAVPGAGVSSPAYQWQVNGINTGTNSNSFSTSALTNGSQVTVLMTINTSCNAPVTVASNIVLISMAASITPQVTIAIPPNICPGQPATFVATPVNGGANPSYQWQINGINAGTNSPSFTTSSLVNGDFVRVLMTSSLTCVSNPVAIGNASNIFVLPLVVPTISISTASSTICIGSTVVFQATATGAGSAAVYQWKVNGINVGTNSTTFSSNTLNSGDQVTCTLKSSLLCALPQSVTSNTVTITTSTSVTPGVTISTASTSFCVGSSVTFTATPTNGGTTPSWQWQVNGVNTGTNSNIFTTNSLANGAQVRVILTSNSPCAVPLTATSNVLSMIASAPVTTAVTITASSQLICPGTPVTFTALPVNGGPTPSFQWQVNGINSGSGGLTFTSNTLLAGSQVRVIMTGSNSCASPTTATSNIITLSAGSTVVPAIIISGNTTVTAGASVRVTASSVVNGGTTPAFQWQDSTAAHNWQPVPGAQLSSLDYFPAASGDRIRCLLFGNAPCASTPIVTSNTLQYNIFGGRAIRLFPNPADDLITIDNLLLSDNWQTMDIFSSGGYKLNLSQNIQSLTKTTVNVGLLAPGFYIVVLRGVSSVPVQIKFIKL